MPNKRDSNRSQVTSELWERLQSALAGAYSLRRWLGAGAFGDVLCATQVKTGQDVAIKVLRVREDENSRRRFRREMRACAALQHPNIVRVLDAGGGQDTSAPLHIVFEYVPGQTLAQFLAEAGTMRVEEALSCMLQVLDGLHTAHARGIVHRDLKPANIMVMSTARGLTTKILDFGIAGLLDDARDGLDSLLTATEDRLGTPAYCAPEQLRGERATPRVDYYAWGLILVEALTGEAVFAGKSLPQVLHAQFSADPVPLPPALLNHRIGELLRWTLEKDPARRAADARRIIEQFERIDTRGIVDESGYLLAPTTSSAATEIAQLPRLRGERRPATALCCVLSLEAELSQSDEEAFEEWSNDLREVVLTVAGRFGGNLIGYSGAELTFYFGLGAIADGSARSAARAALEIRDLCTRRSNLMRARSGWGVQVRLGIHHGMVTVRTPGVTDSCSPSITSLNASQLARAAASGEIAVSANVCHVLRGIMFLEPSEAPPGASASFSASPWFYLRSDPGPPTTERKESIFGRDAELTALDAAWQEVGASGPALVVISGSPGIGKSHLARAWTERLGAVGVSLLQCRCLPETQGSALHPILTLLREQMGPAIRDPQGAERAVGEFLERAGLESASALPLLGSWLGLSNPSWPELNVSPKKRRDLLLDLLVQAFASLCTHATVLLLEDLHWADPTTLELLSKLRAHPFGARFMIVCTLRTGRLPLEDAAHVELVETSSDLRSRILHEGLRIELEPLRAEASRQLVRSIWQTSATPEELLTRVLHRAAGVPLFLLELARSAGSDGDAVPANIAELLSGLIDRLGSAKELAQLAAVAVPDCTYELLDELSRRGPDLLGDLNHLRAAGILLAHDDGSYTFRHALLRDSAYQSIPRRERRKLHRAVVELLERQPSEALKRPWTLALHHHHAGNVEAAMRHGESAAQGALMRFENLEALSFLRKLKGDVRESLLAGWLRDIEDTRTRAEIELRLMALEATALSMTQGWTNEDLDRLCTRATELFVHVAPSATVPLRWAMVQLHVNRGLARDEQGHDSVAPFVDDLLEVADAVGASEFVRLGQMVRGASQLFQAQIAASIATLAAIEPASSAEEPWKYGLDAQIIGRSIACLAKWQRGDTDALAESQQAVALAKQRMHPGTLVLAQLYQASLLHMQRDREGARALCLELLETCERLGIQGYPGYAVIILGWADGDPEPPAQAHAALCAAGQRLTEGYYGSIVAEAQVDAGRLAEASERLQELELRVRSTGELFCLPDILYLRARCAFGLSGDGAQALALLEEALACAEAQAALGLCSSIARRSLLDVQHGRLPALLGSARLAQALSAACAELASAEHRSGVLLKSQFLGSEREPAAS